jgi:hypothetical protein
MRWWSPIFPGVDVLADKSPTHWNSKDIMLNRTLVYISTITFSDVYNYFADNLGCLLYVVDVWPKNAVYFLGIASLISESAELFGSVFTLTLILLTSILVELAIRQLITFGIKKFFKTKNVNKLNTDTSFKRRGDYKSVFLNYFKSKTKK